MLGCGRLILASASPQRRSILAQIDVDFEVCPAGVDELVFGEPAEVARENARLKATAVPGELVLGADTVVAVDGEMLAKPRDADEARAFLGRLSDREHDVLGGIALARDGAVLADCVERTRVRFRALDDATMDWYVATGEWAGRAGGYAIQGRGAALVREIHGDYLNVVGLSLTGLVELLVAGSPSLAR